MTVFKTREVQYASEASFCENASSIGSLTYSARLPVADDISVSLDHPRVEANRMQSRLAESIPGYLSVKRCSIELPVYWCGHGTAPTGALVETWLQDLLSDGLGGGSTSEVGGAAAAAASTTSLTFTGATLLRGGIVRVGSKNDGRADGQPAAVGTPIVTPASLLTALPGAPNAADVIYAAQLAYPAETLGVTKRFLVGHTATGAQYHLLGCQLSGLSFTLPVGGMPMITLKYSGYFWSRGAVTIPSGVAMAACDYAPITAGSLFINAVGTTTRATYQASSINFRVDLALGERKGLGGVQYQDVVGVERTAVSAEIDITIPWDTAWEALYDADGESGTTHQHILLGLNSTAGRAIGLYAPRAYLISPKPTFVNEGDLLFQKLTWRLREGTDTTNDLTRSIFRLFLG
jgi:hypothetical protein